MRLTSIMTSVVFIGKRLYKLSCILNEIAEGVITMYPKYQSIYVLHEDTRKHVYIKFTRLCK